jgi:FkbM family methyltransferase
MSLLNDVISAAGGAGRILRVPEPARRRALLLDYLRMQLKYLLLFRVLGRRITQERFLGFDVHFPNYEQFTIVFNEIFVPQVYRFTPSRPDPLIFDCGANIGMSVLYFKWMYPQSRIVAFEPDPATFELLKRNVEANRLQDVELHCEAVGGEPGSVPFHYLEGYPGWLTQSTVMRASAESKTRMVPMVTLSPLIHEEVDLLKVDTEGSEAGTFAELEASGKLRNIRAMVLEYHHHMEPDDDSLSAFLAVLERNRFGYMISAIFRTPFVTGEFEGLMIGVYRKEPGQPLPKF